MTYPLTEVVVAACIISDFEDSHAKALIFEHPEDQAATKCLLWCFLLRATWVVANVRTRITGRLILLQPLAKIEAKLIVTEPIFMEILGSVKCVCLSLRVRYSRIAEILIDTSFKFGSGIWPTRDLLWAKISWLKNNLGLFCCWADLGTKLQTHAQSYGMPNIVSNVIKWRKYIGKKRKYKDKIISKLLLV